MPRPDGPARSYESPARDAAARARRDAAVEAAMALLAEGGAGGLSLEAVAKRAGVTRLTLYNQFGSRRGLLEAIFDERAKAGGLGRIGEALERDYPLPALMRIVETFCGFWAANAGAWGPLYRAASADEELLHAMAARNERRRGLMREVAARLAVPPPADADLADVLFALTGFATYDALRVGGREEAEICALLKGMATAAVEAAKTGRLRR